MFNFISNMFRNVEPVEPTNKFADEAAERQLALGKSLEYHYLDLYVSALPKSRNYKIQEELHSGQIITHDHCATYEQMAWYVRAVFLPNHPPKFHITAL
jgi:hypothetical protein